MRCLHCPSLIFLRINGTIDCPGCNALWPSIENYKRLGGIVPEEFDISGELRNLVSLVRLNTLKEVQTHLCSVFDTLTKKEPMDLTIDDTYKIQALSEIVQWITGWVDDEDKE